MAQPIQTIPVDHSPMIYAIEATADATPPPLQLTLLELIQAVSEVSETENELIASVVYMLQSGRIRLSGNFRDLAIDEFDH
jgi:hypothetical protein